MGGTASVLFKGNGSRKRKAISVLPEPDLLKKLKTTVIDDPVAAQIFEELGVSDAFLSSGKVLSWALSPEDPAFLDIHTYVTNSQASGYTDRGLKILSILRIISKADNFVDFEEMPEHCGKLRMMLFHGTRAQNVTSILENGLQMPGIFGDAIYFADRAVKSLDYTGAWGEGDIAYLFLCDVLLGKVWQGIAPPPQLPEGYDSMKYVGSNIPYDSHSKVVDGCTWPLGPTHTAYSQTGFNYLGLNEYMVYSAEQVQPKYLLKVERRGNVYQERIE